MANLSDGHGRYLSILGVAPAAPSLIHLRRLVRSQVRRVPFENVSKLYYLGKYGSKDAPGLDRYLDGIDRHGFGGTCYSSNPHFCGLLQALGYDATLCGADMTDATTGTLMADVHVVTVVCLDGTEYLVDVGYAAPFDRPIPADLGRDASVALGNERWVVKPRDEDGNWRVEHIRDGNRIHGYVAKPEPREQGFFQPAVSASYRPDATFMNKLRIVRFGDDSSVGVDGLTVIRANGPTTEIRRLAKPGDLVDTVEQEFGIRAETTLAAMSSLATAIG